MLCTEIVSDFQKKISTYTACSPHVLQKEELLTKIYLYIVHNLRSPLSEGVQRVLSLTGV